MKIFVGIPAYDHKIYAATTAALLEERFYARKEGHSFALGVTPGNSLVSVARDKVVQSFLDTNYDVLFFVDADVSWEPGALTRLATKREEFVGAAYPYKQEPVSFPVTWIREGALSPNESGLCEAHTIPGGFLGLKRSVFRKLREAYPGREYEHHGQKFYAYFHCPPGNGEDATFCKEWREIGGKVWIDTEVALSHWESGREYRGRLGDFLRRK
jgi:hypothetical protein